MARAAVLIQGLETGTVRIAGHLPDFEQQAIRWERGQHCPDSLAALCVGHDVLLHAAAQVVSFGAPVGGSVVALQSYLSQRIG